MPDLLHLIWLGLAAPRLEIDDFWDSIVAEYVVTAADALAEPEPKQEPSQQSEADPGIGGASEHPPEGGICRGHAARPVRGISGVTRRSRNAAGCLSPDLDVAALSSLGTVTRRPIERRQPKEVG
ncbi:MAG: hypothetical protein ACREOF_11765 [Gemmatimonadales bacterium]